MPSNKAATIAVGQMKAAELPTKISTGGMQVSNTAKQEVMAPQVTIAPAVSESAAVVNMIERAARDPTVDIDKMERLVLMQREMLAAQKEQAFNDAMARAQSEMCAVAADASNPQTRSRYASYFALDKAVRHIYTKHGFALSFDTEPSAQPNHILVVCYVSCAGHTRKYRVDMPADGKGAKGGDVMTLTHASGSAMTYGQRYLLKAIFNIAIGSDDDGNAAGKPVKQTVSPEAADKMRAQITALITETKMPIDKFLTWAKAESISDIPSVELADIVASLQERKRKMGDAK